MELTRDQINLLIRFQKDEITGCKVYRNLAAMQKDGHNKEILNKIADDEQNHYDIYSKLTGKEILPGKWEVFKYSVLSYILGPTFAIKLMEKGEIEHQMLYAKLSEIPQIPPIIADEEKHEKELIGMINEEKLNYMGSVVLGLNDALIELTGVLAGFTFALQDPKLIALTGSITGVAAALSMAASEYFSTKSEETERHAYKSAIYTGIAYIFTVVILILPYILIKNIYVSLVVTLIAAILIIAGFNYYFAVVREENFKRRFSEMAILSMAVAALSFGVGYLLKYFFHVNV
jgi:VIT1/CCC1 family predicted Fe2+/Mn2+ transporter